MKYVRTNSCRWWRVAILIGWFASFVEVPAAVLFGRLVDASGETGVNGVRVSAVVNGQTIYRYSGDDGTVSFDIPVTGIVTARVGILLTPLAYETSKQDIVIDEHSEPVSFEFRKRSTLSVSGRVVTPGGETITCTRILAKPQETGYPISSGDVYPDGSFTLNLLPTLYKLVMEAYLISPWYADPQQLIVDEISHTNPVFISALRGSQISGQLVEAKSEVLPEYGSLSLSQAGIDPDEALRAYLKPDGSYIFSGIPPGHYTLMFQIGISGREYTLTTLDVLPGQDISDLNITWTNDADQRGALSGRLAYADGRAITGIAVHASYENQLTQGEYVSFTDDDGHFNFSDMDPGRLAIVVGYSLDAVYAETNAMVVAGGELAGLNIILPTGAIKGEVRDTSNQPASGALISIHKTGSDWKNLVNTDEHGQFHIPLLEDGEYELLVILMNSKTMIRQIVNIENGQIVEGLVLAPGLILLCGSVMDAEGNPKTGALISTAQLGDENDMNNIYTTTTDDGGRFCFSNLNAASHSLVIASPFFMHKIFSVSVTEQMPDIQVVVGGSGELSGQVVDETGSGAPRSIVMAVKKEAEYATSFCAQTDDNGYFTLKSLAEGDYMLFANGTSGITAWVSASVPTSSESEKVVLPITSDGASISGNIMSDKPKEDDMSPFIHLEHAWSLPIVSWSEIDAEGRFHYAGLPSGDYNVIVFANSEIQRRLVSIKHEESVVVDFDFRSKEENKQ